MSADGEQGGVLLPCPNPWCEGVEGVEASRHIVTEKWRVCCDDCMIEGPWADTCDLAFAAWNNRAVPATDTPVPSDAVLMIIRNVLYRSKMNGCSADVYDTAEEIAAALAKHPTSPESAS